MLRVITDRQRDSYRLDLHGVLSGEWVPLLEEHWRSIIHALPSAKVTLVLSNVDFIDSAGEQVLQRMAGKGVEFVVAGCMNRYVIDNLKPGVLAAKGVRR
jgi:anti-anti-sigma regulatory factor